MGEFEAGQMEEYAQKSLEILGKIKASPLHGRQGFKEFCNSLGIEDMESWLTPWVHRYSSCFNCPYPCNTFVKYNEDPKTFHLSEVKEPGLLLTNLLDVVSFKQCGMGSEETFRALEKARRLGLEPNSSARQLLDDKKTWNDLDSLLDAQITQVAPWPIEGGEALGEKKAGLFSTWPPPLPVLGRFPIDHDPKKTFGFG